MNPVRSTGRHPIAQRAAHCCEMLMLLKWFPCENIDRPLDEFAVFDLDNCGACELAWDLLQLPDSRLAHTCAQPNIRREG